MVAFPNIGSEEWAQAGWASKVPVNEFLFRDDLADPDVLVRKVRQPAEAALRLTRRRRAMDEGAMETALHGLGVADRLPWEDTAAPRPFEGLRAAEPPPASAEYSAAISRANPLLLVFLIDQSGSMNDPMPRREGHTKSEALASVINGLLNELVLRCSKGEEIRDYFHIGLITYRGTRVLCGWEGSREGSWVRRISEVGDNPLRVDYVRRMVRAPGGQPKERSVPQPVWVTSYAAGKTPMVAALRQARELVAEWLSRYPQAFPPIVINVTDGVPSDGDPLPEMRAIMGMRSSDGSALMLNIQLSKADQDPVRFPVDDRLLENKGAHALLRASELILDG